MIDFRETKSQRKPDPKEAGPEVAPRGRPLWMWLSLAGGVLMFGLVGTWLGSLFKVKTAEPEKVAVRLEPLAHFGPSMSSHRTA